MDNVHLKEKKTWNLRRNPLRTVCLHEQRCLCFCYIVSCESCSSLYLYHHHLAMWPFIVSCHLFSGLSKLLFPVGLYAVISFSILLVSILTHYFQLAWKFCKNLITDSIFNFSKRSRGRIYFAITYSRKEIICNY